MKKNTEHLKNIGVKLFTLILILLIFMFKILKIKINILQITSYSITLTTIFLVLFDQFFWRIFFSFMKKKKKTWWFLEKYETPILKEKYSCLINYEWNGVKGSKEAIVEIDQTYTSITVKLKTNEIYSTTLISDIVLENNDFTLYYVYQTNPKVRYSELNPMDFGACRISLDSNQREDANEKICGTYWTRSNSKGDIELY